MAEAYEAVSAHWTSPKRRERRSARFWGALRPREILDDRTAAQAELGPYETRYDITNGYGTDRVIVTP